jgi:hypothetical protein
MFCLEITATAHMALGRFSKSIPKGKCILITKCKSKYDERYKRTDPIPTGQELASP